MDAGPSIQAGRGLICTPGFKARRKGSKVPPAGIESSSERAVGEMASKQATASMRNGRALFDELEWLVAIIVKTCFAFAL
jgi:hypothetical protein